MENRFSNRDFEQFVKQNADQYRMYPSEKVWKNIHYNLHTRRRWYGIGLGLLLLTISTVTWLMIEPGKKQHELTAYNLQPTTTKIQTTQKPSVPIYVATRKNKPVASVMLTNGQDLNDEFMTVPTADQMSSENFETLAVVVPVVTETSTPAFSPTAKVVTKTSPATPARTSLENVVAMNNQPENNNDLAVAAGETKTDKQTTAEENVSTITQKDEIYPMTIESVVNEYRLKKSRKRLSWEAYFSPTISYRKLVENKGFINSTLANNNALNYYTAISDINSLVTHKPDIGFQMGLTAGYPLSKSLKITTGLQLNVSKYDIKAYTYNTEVATIALNTGTGGSNSVSTLSTYRNFSGDNASWLRNLYVSASLPVGLELNLNPAGKNEFGIAATLQPTYLLGDRVYLLSTDYKNYVEMPSLTRKWNFSTGLEVFAGVNTGKIHWRVGPHVRYQLLSSFDNKYPVKEYLFDFGLKVGVMLKK